MQQITTPRNGLAGSKGASPAADVDGPMFADAVHASTLLQEVFAGADASKVGLLLLPLA